MSKTKRINGHKPMLGERIAMKRYGSELERAIATLRSMLPRISEQQALDLIARAGSVGVITTLQGNPPLWPLVACPLGAIEQAITTLRKGGARPAVAMINPEDLAELGARAGAPTLCGADGKPLGAPPQLEVAGVQLRPWGAITRGWCTLLEVLLTLDPQPDEQRPVTGKGEA